MNQIQRFRYFDEEYMAIGEDVYQLVLSKWQYIEDITYPSCLKFMVGVEFKESDQVVLEKAPPGPKPKRFGPDIVWDDDKRRWVKGGQQGSSQSTELTESPTPTWKDYSFHQVDFGDMPFPEGRKIHPKVKNWKIPILVEDGKNRLNTNRIANYIRLAVSAYTPKVQEFFQRDMEIYPVKVIRDESWQDELVSRDLPSNTAAFCHSDHGVFVPQQIDGGTVVHEMAHQFDYAAGINEREDLQILYLDATMNDTVITNYAKTNVMEYFAEGVRGYAMQPQILKAKDPKMYKWLGKFMQGGA